MSVTLRTITGGILTAAEHAMMNFGAYPHDGFLNPTVNVEIDGSSIHFNDDIYGLIAGRMFRITDETFSFVLPISGTLAGTIYLKLDLDNIDSPLQLLSTTDTPPAETVFESGVVNFDSQEVIRYICTFNVTPTAITDLDVVYPVGVWGHVDLEHVDGTIPISKGGTGATTKENAVRALLPNANTTDVTHFLGVNSSWAGGSVKLADVRTLLHIYDSEQSRTKNYVLAAPSSANGAATFRKLVAADLPSASALGAVPASTTASTQTIIVDSDGATVYRFTFTNGANIRVDTSTDGGANWTTGTELFQKQSRTQPVANGGTGATTAANARSNLGVKITELWSGTFKSGSSAATFSANYDAFILWGTSGGTVRESIFVPKAALGSSDTQVLISDDACYLTVKLKYSGSTGTMTWVGNKNTSGDTLTSGFINKIYGLNG